MFSGVQVKRTATQSISTSTLTPVTWQTEVGGFDIGGWWSSGTNIVVPAGAIPAGYTTIAVQVVARTNFAANSSGTRFIMVLLNGSITQTYSTGAIASDPTEVSVFDWMVVAAGDVITADVKQTSGGNLNISATNTVLTVVRQAPVA